MAVKNLICLVGRTASGKDTVAKALAKKGLKPVVSYTTRPIRETETEGVEHFFITEQAADDLVAIRKDEIAAYTVIKGCRYFTMIDALMNANIYVIDPKGIAYLKEKYPEINMIIAYVRCSDEIRERYALALRGDNAKEFEERREAEDEQFTEFENTEGWDILIENNSTLDDLMQKTDDLYDRYVNNTNETLNEALIDSYPDDHENIIMFESPNYRSAVIGISEDMRLIYDYDKMIEHLVKYDKMDYDEAIEFIEYNTIRALPYYPDGPIVMHQIEFE